MSAESGGDEDAALQATQPGCVVYADHGFVGASPELLVRRSGADVTARPMAGTREVAWSIMSPNRSQSGARSLWVKSRGIPSSPQGAGERS